MITDLRPYAEYKESGLPWLGQVPGHWGLSRSKRLFSARKDLASSEDVQLSATQAYGVIPQSEFEEKVGRRVVKISMHLEKRRHVEKDDFVISMRSFQGGIERAWASGAIRSSYVVLKPESGVNVGFFAYLFKSHSYIRALQATADFIRDGQDLNFSNFCGVDLPTVPLAEQAAIARFLNYANGLLERAIRAKRKVITLLNEQRQAIIHSAVTCGLDPSVPLKASGIPWLGDIPQHWEVRRGKYLFQPIDVRSAKGVEELLTVSSSDGIVPRSTKTVMMFKAASYAGHKLCWPGDLVINSLWAWAKGLGFSSHHGIVSTAYGVYRPRPTYSKHAPYWHELLRSPAYDWEFQTRSRGIWKSRLQLTDDSFLAMRIIVPPEEEAVGIVQRIRVSTSGLRSAISRLEREIELLREYRSRLVADVVTGKLDVREAAEGLPDLKDDASSGETADEVTGVEELEDASGRKEAQA